MLLNATAPELSIKALLPQLAFTAIKLLLKLCGGGGGCGIFACHDDVSWWCFKYDWMASPNRRGPELIKVRVTHINRCTSTPKCSCGSGEGREGVESQTGKFSTSLMFLSIKCRFLDDIAARVGYWMFIDK